MMVQTQTSIVLCNIFYCSLLLAEINLEVASLDQGDQYSIVEVSL